MERKIYVWSAKLMEIGNTKRGNRKEAIGKRQ
jgi:hypothetical protein